MPAVRVLHVFARLDRGGAELRTLDMMRKLDSDDVRFDFCVLGGQAGSLDDEVRALGGDVYYCRLGLAFPFHFWRLLSRVRPDVVHSHVFLNSGFILALGAVAGIPVRIAHFRTTGTDRVRRLPQRIRDAVARRLIGLSASQIVGVSRGALEHAWGRNWQDDPRCRVVYPGIDTNAYRNMEPLVNVREELGIPEAARVFVHVGRMQTPKNHPRLVKMFAEIRKLAPDAVLVLVGRGGNAIESEVRALVADASLEDDVIFLGERDDVHRILAVSHLMVFPSTREGLPGAVLEAAAAGVPVLATDLPGVEEIAAAVPGVTTMRLSETDAAWAKAALRLARDRAPREQQLLRGTDFDLDQSLRNHLSVWCPSEAPERPSLGS